ncbi:MAG: lamin tail domain-containing protein, partial [Acidobacteria bacterium]|nr:lamin tail domain-containing protein [Acidobacteriota bacterium]
MNKKLIFPHIAFTFALMALVLSGTVIAQRTAERTAKPLGIQRDNALVSTTLVISQAYGGGGGTTGTYQNDYVEIKNISSSPQSLNGLSLMYGSATGQFASSGTNAFGLPDVTIQPGQYYLVQTANAGTGGVILPVAADASTTNLSMSGTNGKVALVITASFPVNTCGATATPCALPHAGIVDLVSWGTGNNAEGDAATNGGAALTSTQGNVRKAAGCTDTDNNNADFDVITAPVPRNMASSYSACGSSGPAPKSIVDFDGDGYTDYTVVRNVGGGPSGAIHWFYNLNPANPASGGPT